MADSAAAILQIQVSKSILELNLEGVSHEDSLIAPAAGGNCLNWLVGHLVTAYDNFLAGIGAGRVWSDAQDAPYRRGSASLDPARAMPFDELTNLYQEAHGRFVEHAAALSDEDLAKPAPYSPGDNPGETLGSLLNLTAFHQAYHVGQTGLLRRVIGRPGAIR